MALTMVDEDNTRLAMYTLYLATSEKVGDRRAQANAWMLSVNSAIVALYGYLQAVSAIPAADAVKQIWLWIIPAAGILVCIAWVVLLTSYRTLNRAKFTVLMEIEKDLPLALFTREREVYKTDGRMPLSKIESGIPWTFAALHLVMVIAVLVT